MPRLTKPALHLYPIAEM